METTLKLRVLYAESLLSWGRAWKADFVWGEEENFIWCLRYHIASRRRWMCALNLVSFYFIFWDTVSFMLPTPAALEFLSSDDPPASAFWDSKTIDASLHLSLDSIFYPRKPKGRDEYVSASCLGWWLFTANLTRIRIIWKTGRRDCWWCLWPYFQRRSTLECTTSCQHPSFSASQTAMMCAVLPASAFPVTNRAPLLFSSCPSGMWSQPHKINEHSVLPKEGHDLPLRFLQVTESF